MNYTQKMKHGITLIELLLVIALIAIISAIGAPAVYHNFNREADQNILQSVTSELEYSRSMGLMEYEGYSTFQTFANSDKFICATQTKRLEGNVSFETSEFFYFDHLGRLLDASGNLETANRQFNLITDGRTVGTILITPAGLIKRQ